MDIRILFFPGEENPPGIPLKESRTDGEFSRSRKKVLVVDDERLIADTLAAILAEHDFEVAKAYSAQEAIETAQLLEPDILLSDVLMPQTTGIDLAIELTRHFPDTRIVLLSGQAATAALMNQAKADGHDFELLPKPIHPEELVAKLKQK